jgi:uncharacterized protein (TIGR00369 family)
MATAGETRFMEMVFPDLVNHYGTLFGGHALRLMDMAAFVAASRYTRQTVVTAAMDRVDFHSPVRQGQLLDVEGSVTATGKTSVTVEVTLHAEDLLTGERRLCTRGKFVLVAVDEGGNPVSLALDPTSPETRP